MMSHAALASVGKANIVSLAEPNEEDRYADKNNHHLRGEIEAALPPPARELQFHLVPN
jgi:hypothetical protein